MKALLSRTAAVLAACYMTWSAAGCGGGASCNDPPNVEGTYDLTDIDAGCAGLFDTVITVNQTQCNVTLEATTAGFLDAEGTIDDSGNFEVENSNGTCEGRITGGVGTATCTNNDGETCDLTYTER